ncbi:MAG: chloramphenicol acetyltransferase [Flavobacteriaceae bacterium]|nr:chloramphenicol acetyltransferase [Flavobacteriaceae bacterium]NNK60534.1 chloramphenicol acetyltransferase [Flavobacteriaceae bacterium]RZW56912.1 MAG: chloramphenicol acetyltransferase [Flavobacteriaceae bacterium]
MTTLDLHTWKRKKHFEHFNALLDPYFALTVPIDTTNAYRFAKETNSSFFSRYLHDCMKAINAIENFRYRIEGNDINIYDSIHASATLMRSDKTFGFSFIEFENERSAFYLNVEKEKLRIENSDDLYPPYNGLDCIHCSALPWLNFTGHKEPFSGSKDSVPKIAFGKVEDVDGKKMMNVSISANHALVDGYHVGLFVDYFQKYLNT